MKAVLYVFFFVFLECKGLEEKLKINPNKIKKSKKNLCKRNKRRRAMRVKTGQTKFSKNIEQ